MLQFKRGTTEQCNSFIPLEGQPLWNLDTSVLTIGDGVTPGGVSLAGVLNSVANISDITPYTATFLTTVGSSVSALSYFGAAPVVHTHYLADLVDITAFGTSLVQAPDAFTAVALLSTVSVQDLNAIQVQVNNINAQISVIDDNLTDINSMSARRIDVPSDRPFADTDNGATLVVNNTVTLTANSGLPSFFWCEIVQIGTNQVTFAPGSMLIRNSFNFTKTRGQYAVATARVVNGELILSGDMSN